MMVSNLFEQFHDEPSAVPDPYATGGLRAWDDYQFRLKGVKGGGHPLGQRPPILFSPPVVSGTTVVGQTLHCTTGVWAGMSTLTFSYQWKRGATNVGTNSADYLLGTADIGFFMSCLVTAHRAVTSATAMSNLVGPVVAVPVATAPVNVVLPLIADLSPTVGEPLFCDKGVWNGTAPITYAYQWYQVSETASELGEPLLDEDDAPLLDEDDETLTTGGETTTTTVPVGTNSPNYTPVPGDIGKSLYCRVTATNAVGTAFANSNVVGLVVVGLLAPVNTVLPVIDDVTPQEGETLTCSQGTWTGTAPIAYNYQWYQAGEVGPTETLTTGGTPLTDGGELLTTSGATSAPILVGAGPTYGLVAGDVGKNIFCRVTGSNVAGSSAANSAEVGPVAPAAVAGPPVSVVAPAIADVTPQVDEVLHTTDGTWDGSLPITYGYEWHRVTVVAPSSTGAPSIADVTPQVDEILHVTDGTWDGDTPITYTYEWHRIDPAATITSSPTATNVENAVLAHALTASEAVTWSIVGGADAARFEVSGSTLRWLADGTKDFEAPNDADTDNQYVVTVRATDSASNTTDQTVTVTVTNVDDVAPTITSSASVSNPENTVLAHSLTADEAVTWSLVGGADLARFELSGSTLRWLSNGTKNFEVPDDADTNNAYIVQVRATDTASNTTDQTVTVTVTNVVEATLTFDFAANTSTIAGAASTSTAPLTVTRTGTAAWAEKLDGTWQNFAAATARRTDKGLLVEETRTNVVLQNRTQTNASWVKTTCTATKNQVGIDGAANSCCSLTATAGNATCLLTTSVVSGVRWQSAFIKRLVGTGNIQMTMDNGTTWTTLTITSSWARYSIPTQTLANPVVGFRIVTSGDSIAVDMVQNENSNLFASSPISTTTAAVTRPPDLVVINTAVAPIASWFNQPAGTLFAEGIPHAGASSTSIVFQIDNGTVGVSHYVGIPGPGVSANCGATTNTTGQGSFSATGASGVNKTAWAYAVDDMAGSFNGGAVVTDTSGTMPSGMTTTRIGRDNTVYWNGYIRKLTFYDGRMANADLVTLTT